nr:UDP-N-acetylglucosamine 2-epimerase [Candidatus Omnitrophota bacterium]
VIGTDTNKIIKSVEKLLKDKKAYALMAKAKNPYGDGKASIRIVKAMKAQA